MHELSAAEYRALRRTIAQRGTVRPILFVVGLVASMLGGLVTISIPPWGSLLPLLVLVATFEALRTLHAGVERIGRYLQVFYETDADTAGPHWETVAMQLGPALPGTGGHPLFLPVFWMACLLGVGLSAHPPFRPLPFAATTLLHLAFVGWTLHTDRGVRRQRAQELARFEELRRVMQARRPME